MYNDTKTRFDRIGYGFLYRNIAQKAIFIGLGITLLMVVGTVLIERATAELNYKSAIASIRYENVRHK